MRRSSDAADLPGIDKTGDDITMDRNQGRIGRGTRRTARAVCLSMDVLESRDLKASLAFDATIGAIKVEGTDAYPETVMIQRNDHNTPLIAQDDTFDVKLKSNGKVTTMSQSIFKVKEIDANLYGNNDIFVNFSAIPCKVN